MKKHESRNDRVIAALSWLLRAEQETEGIGDYGQSTGIRAEVDQLRIDVDNAFISIERRAWNLVNKAESYKLNIEEGLMGEED